MQWIPSVLRLSRNFHLARKIFFYLVPLFSCLSLTAEDGNCVSLLIACYSHTRACVRNGCRPHGQLVTEILRHLPEPRHNELALPYHKCITWPKKIMLNKMLSKQTMQNATGKPNETAWRRKKSLCLTVHLLGNCPYRRFVHRRCVGYRRRCFGGHRRRGQ
ncbi:hypothetical protein BJV77DRAFT_745158 [Russula vinacea]|nr:hypothetical protein BJV77DRAFT_745158 [Russula vinacea]